MNALIYLNLDHLHPVINGVWHHARFVAVPAPGDAITTLCGETAVAVFEPTTRRGAHGPPLQCPFCDVAYRRACGLAIRPGHPGLLPRRRP